MAHLDVFLAWQRAKPVDGGLTLTEVLEMPAAMRADFSTFYGLMADERKQVKARKPRKKRNAVRTRAGR